MEVWQVKTPAMFGNLLDAEREVVRWQFYDEETANKFFARIRLEKRTISDKKGE
jgi:hypothetical protein